MTKRNLWWLMKLCNDEPGDGGGGPATSADSAGGEGTSGGGDTADSLTEGSVNWAGIGDDLLADDLGGEEGGVVVPASTAPAEGTGAATEPPATPEPSATPATPAAPSATPAAPAPAATPALEVPAATPAATPPSDEEYQTWRNGRIEQLATSTYAINDEDAAALLTEPEKVLPAMAARMHMEVLESAMRTIQAVLPSMLGQHQAETQREASARGLFAQANPDLTDPRLEPAIMQLGATYRQMNPGAGPEEAARAIGSLVRAALGMAAPVAAAAPSVTAPAPQIPFTPARGGGSSGGRAQVSDNLYTALAEEFLDEDK